MAEFRWALYNSEKIRTFLGAIKLLGTVNEVCVVNVTTERLDLVAENLNADTICICTFKRDFFDEYAVTIPRLTATLIENLLTVIDPHVTSAMSAVFVKRQQGYLDIQINYQSGAVGSSGIPLDEDLIGDIRRHFPMSLQLNEAWISAPSKTWAKNMLNLFPGKHSHLAFSINRDHLGVRKYDLERIKLGKIDAEVRLPTSLFKHFAPIEECEITEAPFPPIKAFIERSAKFDLDVQMLPVNDYESSQLDWQAVGPTKSFFFTILISCAIASSGVKLDTNDDEFSLAGIRNLS
mmetsp:Transcript_9521/g.18445  ORF Transcript_9521/g.18445 Transcript_9521/m.18445 type:complete len:293 (-) Transcript_9521:1082-1960(-)